MTPTPTTRRHKSKKSLKSQSKSKRTRKKRKKRTTPLVAIDCCPNDREEECQEKEDPSFEPPKGAVLEQALRRDRQDEMEIDKLHRFVEPTETKQKELPGNGLPFQKPSFSSSFGSPTNHDFSTPLHEQHRRLLSRSGNTLAATSATG